MCEQLVAKSLGQSIATRQPAPNMIHHTDRGGQYAGQKYRAILRCDAIKHESRRGR